MNSKLAQRAAPEPEPDLANIKGHVVVCGTHRCVANPRPLRTVALRAAVRAEKQDDAFA
jgi:hypothetical protein